MSAPIIPWAPSNIPSELQNELNRRKTVRGFNFVPNQKGEWDKSNGDWINYKGPMTPWVRVCSNSAGHPAVNKPRFIFSGGKGFYQTYGFQPPGSSTDDPIITPQSKYQIIGYTPGVQVGTGPGTPPRPHIIENSLKNPTNKTGQEQSNYPIHVPTPEISRVSVTVQKELFRRAEIEWVCFSWEQLVYMTPYFLVPGISVMLEWGWNHFNPASLVKLSDETLMAQLWRNAYPLYFKNIILSKGNYDVLYGIITNFNWSMEGNRIVCMTEITSKDRLYAGISKDMGLTVNDNSDTNTPRPVFQALRDFMNKDSTLLNLKTIAESEPGTELTKLTGAATPSSGSIKGAETQNIIWLDILSPILSEQDPNIRGIKVPYIHGVFSGRPKKFYDDPIGLGRPGKHDFDKSNIDKVDPTKVWINMGMIVEILNYFSGLDGGKGEPMFQVDITNTVIGGHPNMISCNRDVLIPNAGAPKFHYGAVGLQSFSATGNQPPTEYQSQFAQAQPADTPSDLILRRTCYQIRNPGSGGQTNVCYRNNLDYPINFLRYKFRSSPPRGLGYLGYTNFMNRFSFPAVEDKQLPPSTTGLGKSTSNIQGSIQGNFVEKYVSGMLSDIYLSYSAFQAAVLDPDSKTSSYTDIYRKILSILNDSVDGFWDLVLVEADNIMTITDRNFINTQSKLGQDVNPTYSFDYFDTDSIIKSIRFRPALTDAQATRAIYGEVNNSGSLYVQVDKNDLLNYQFRDAIVLNQKERTRGDTQGDLNKRTTAKQQVRDVLGQIQKLNTSENDDSLQMTIDRSVVRNIFGSTTIPPSNSNGGPFEYIKLCLPSDVSKQIFRWLIDDKDEDNNPRYCAIQPGIRLELTLQGIGGLRTFQYFLVKNLPAPYSHRDVIFRIIDIHHTIAFEGGGWDTVVYAGLLPLKKYIKNRLTAPPGGWSEPVKTTSI